MGARIGVVGSINVDLVTYIRRMPMPGETVEALSFEMHHGGKGANQAVAAAKLGSDVLMLGKVGDDIFGANALDNLKRHGIDARHVGIVPGVSSGIAPIFVDEHGENRILIVTGANRHVLPPDIDRAAGDLARCDLILLQLEIPLETVYHVVALAAARGVEVALNPAPARPELDLEWLRRLSFLVPNRTELTQLSGRPAETAEEAEAAARSLIRAGIGCVIVTLGAEGALLVARDASRHIPPVEVAAVDTTGAGDALIGSFAHFYAQSRDVAGALHHAVRYAAHSITRRGAQSSYADQAEFQAFRDRVDGRASG